MYIHVCTYLHVYLHVHMYAYNIYIYVRIEYYRVMGWVGWEASYVTAPSRTVPGGYQLKTIPNLLPRLSTAGSERLRAVALKASIPQKHMEESRSFPVWKLF